MKKKPKPQIGFKSIRKQIINAYRTGSSVVYNTTITQDQFESMLLSAAKSKKDESKDESKDTRIIIGGFTFKIGIDGKSYLFMEDGTWQECESPVTADGKIKEEIQIY